GKSYLNQFPRVLNGFLGGWELSGIFRANTGPALTPTLSANISGFGRSSDRPNVVGDWKLSNPSPTTGWFNKAAFVAPVATPGCGAACVGNAAPGILTGPGYAGFDASLMKRFYVGENKNLQFRIEM